MPIYEYLCDGCGYEFEVMQKISDKPIAQCSQCGSHHVHKLISQTSFKLKGSGWYVTDYAKKNTCPPGDKNTSTASKTDKKDNQTQKSDSTKSESKKSESKKSESKTPRKNKPRPAKYPFHEFS